MAKRVATILLLLVVSAGVLLAFGKQDWFQYFLAMAAWDIFRSVGQTWYMVRKLDSQKVCRHCGKTVT